MSQVPTSQVVGRFVDGIAGRTRSPATVAGRALEEMVELALAAGLSAGEVMGHVMDSLHNQALKETCASKKTVFPSGLAGGQLDIAALAEECADVHLLIKDLCYVSEIDLDAAEAAKWAAFVKKDFRVTPEGVIYAVKPHIKG